MSDIYAAVDQLVIADGFRAGPVCDALEVCRSGFDWWRFGRESERAVIDAHSEPEIRDIFWRNHRRYGARRIAVALAARGIACGVARVSRLLKKQGLFAIQPHSYRPKTTQSERGLGYNANLLVDREPPADVNQVWVADITTYTGGLALTRFGAALEPMAPVSISRGHMGWMGVVVR